MFTTYISRISLVVFTLVLTACEGEQITDQNEQIDEVGSQQEPLTCNSWGGYDANVSMPSSPASGSFWGSNSTLPANQYPSCGSGNDSYLVRIAHSSSRTVRAIAKWTEPVPTDPLSCSGSFLEVKVRQCLGSDCSHTPAQVVTVRGIWVYQFGFCLMPVAQTTYFQTDLPGVSSYRVAATAYTTAIWPYTFYKKVSAGLEVQ
ncbi:MAG: hypothetical protein MUF64_29590 [Polyangiaceae bacterium]|jgi:hypothetical protein|nr:hypothetical protein [Polyangiaceae bacterium]